MAVGPPKQNTTRLSVAEVEELERRRAFALQMGGEEGVARQHLNGKLTVRERLALFADPGSFREFTGLAGEGTYGESGELVHFRPKAAVEDLRLGKGWLGLVMFVLLFAPNSRGSVADSTAASQPTSRALRATVATAPSNCTRCLRTQRPCHHASKPDGAPRVAARVTLAHTFVHRSVVACRSEVEVNYAERCENHVVAGRRAHHGHVVRVASPRRKHVFRRVSGFETYASSTEGRFSGVAAGTRR